MRECLMPDAARATGRRAPSPAHSRQSPQHRTDPGAFAGMSSNARNHPWSRLVRVTIVVRADPAECLGGSAARRLWTRMVAPCCRAGPRRAASLRATAAARATGVLPAIGSGRRDRPCGATGGRAVPRTLESSTLLKLCCRTGDSNWASPDEGNRAARVPARKPTGVLPEATGAEARCNAVRAARRPASGRDTDRLRWCRVVEGHRRPSGSLGTGLWV